MNEYSMVEGVVDAFREYGFSAEVVAAPQQIDGCLILEKEGVRREFSLEVKLPLTINAGVIPNQSGHLYVTDHVSARTAEVLRRMGVQYIDAAGNLFLEGGGWYIDIRGRKRHEATELTAQYLRLEAPTNLYSAKRAQVIFALLTWGDLLGASVRELAEVAGVSTGIAGSTTSELRRRDLWPDSPQPREALIDGWASAFPETLARSLTIRAVRAENLEAFYGPVLVSGEAAPSAQMRATSGVVYVDELTTELLMENRWRTDGSPNLVVRRRFWSRKDELPHGEAPHLLVYGDLHASDDPRVRSVAVEYRHRL